MVSWLSVLERSLRQKVGLQDIVRDSHIRRHPFEGVSFYVVKFSAALSF